LQQKLKLKQLGLKGIVHFKMNMLSSFTHRQVVQFKPYVLNTKEDILKKMGNQTVDDFHHQVFFSFYGWKSMGSINCLVYQHYSKFLLLCAAEK